jgi:hypothetical protein
MYTRISLFCNVTNVLANIISALSDQGARMGISSRIATNHQRGGMSSSSLPRLNPGDVYVKTLPKTNDLQNQDPTPQIPRPIGYTKTKTKTHPPLQNQDIQNQWLICRSWFCSGGSCFCRSWVFAL